MNNRSPVTSGSVRKRWLSVTLMLCGSLLATAGQAQTIPTDGSMNLLIILADDVGTDNISAYNDYPNDPAAHANSAQTPNIDGLSSNGVRFENVYANPKCSPSRASLFTGRHPYRHGVLYTDASTLASSEVTLAEAINVNSSGQNAYSTALFGKWHLGHNTGQTPETQGWEYWEGSLTNIQNSYFDWYRSVRPTPAPGALRPDGQTTEYATKDNVEAALDWIENSTQAGQPWFVTIAFNAGHSPFHVPPSGTYSAARIPNLPSTTAGDPCSGRYTAECYRAMVESMDHYIGEFLTDLGNIRGGADLANTIIVFVGDNGTPTSVTETQAGTIFDSSKAKGTTYEGGIRVPLIVTTGDPTLSLNAGVSSELVQIQDVFTTLATVANIDVAADLNRPVHGESLLPLIDAAGSGVFSRTEIYSEQFSASKGIDDWTVSDGTLKYMAEAATGEYCFNLNTNPEQAASLDLLTTGNPAQKRNCRALKRARHCSGAQCP